MKNYFKSTSSLIAKMIIVDPTSRYLFWSSVALSIVDYVIWKLALMGPDVFVYTRLTVYPIQYLAVIFVINTFLGLVAYEKEKEITTLLFIGYLIVGGLTLAMELFYIFAH